MTQKEPAWDLSREYPGLGSREYETDFQVLEARVGEVARAAALIASSTDAIADCQGLAIGKDRLDRAAWNLVMYAEAHLRLDCLDQTAQKWKARAEALLTRIEETYAPLFSWVASCSDEDFARFLSDPGLKGSEFYFRERRAAASGEQVRRLATVTSFRGGGIDAWSRYQRETMAAVRVEVEHEGKLELVSLDRSRDFLDHKDESVRRSTWEAKERALSREARGMASAANAIAAWRLAEDDLEFGRDEGPRRFLEVSLREQRISAETLDALMESVRARIAIPQEAIRRRFRLLGIESSKPWDGIGPYRRNPFSPQCSWTFKEVIGQIKRAYGRVDPEMAAFVDEMVRMGCVEGRRLPNAHPVGAMLRFSKSCTPRVFMPLTGTVSCARDLAHELGHAFHFQLMRDLPVHQERHPATLGETASIFAENVWREQLADDARKTGEAAPLRALGWMDLGEAVRLAFVQARFDFEKAIYEERRTGVLPAEAIGAIWKAACAEAYGLPPGNFSGFEWMENFHFFLPEVRFYNYPYLFGWLFALGLVAEWRRAGPGFFPAYRELLRNSGRATAEKLVQDSLGVDIRKRDFWNAGLDLIEARVLAFERA